MKKKHKSRGYRSYTHTPNTGTCLECRMSVDYTHSNRGITNNRHSLTCPNEPFDWSDPENTELWEYWKLKRSSSRHRRIPFNLTLREMKQLLDEADIRIAQARGRGSEYVLGRFNDLGGYEAGNCSFVTRKKNTIELMDRLHCNVT